jgi:hypothetical protein
MEGDFGGRGVKGMYNLNCLLCEISSSHGGESSGMYCRVK